MTSSIKVKTPLLERGVGVFYLAELIILISRGYRYRRIFVNFESRVKVLVSFFRKAEVGSRNISSNMVTQRLVGVGNEAHNDIIKHSDPRAKHHR